MPSNSPPDRGGLLHVVRPAGRLLSIEFGASLTASYPTATRRNHPSRVRSVRACGASMVCMSDPDESDEPTQATPAGATIPVPDREDVMEALLKVPWATPDEQEPLENEGEHGTE